MDKRERGNSKQRGDSGFLSCQNNIIQPGPWLALYLSGGYTSDFEKAALRIKRWDRPCALDLINPSAFPAIGNSFLSQKGVSCSSVDEFRVPHPVRPHGGGSGSEKGSSMCAEVIESNAVDCIL
jgi:hypothetical protein